MVQEMAPSAKPGGGEAPLTRALEKHGEKAVWFLILLKSDLGDEAYKELIKTIKDIVKRSSCPEGGITVKNCEEILSQLFVGQARVLKGFHRFLEGLNPFEDHSPQAVQGALCFFEKAKGSEYMSNKDYNYLLGILCQYIFTKMEIEDLYQKVKKAMHNSPELLEAFEVFLPDHLRVALPNEQSCTSPRTSTPDTRTIPTDKMVSCSTPYGNRIKTMDIKSNASELGYPHEQDHEETESNFRQKHTQRTPPCSLQMPTEGNLESLYAQEYEGDKTDPLPDWSPSRESELPPTVELDMCTRCTTSYYLLPENCSTLKSSYQTKLGQSIFNDTLVSATSGRENCFKFRTKNNYEETVFKCEDDMFESDMLLQRYKATADFIGNLQNYVDRDMKIQEHLTPLHRRCIEQLYDEHGLDMLDALWEKIDTSAALAILHSRLNQKIEELSEARLSLNKTCSNIIANNYHRSLDHCSSSFKQSDKKRMSRKALLAEAKEINMARVKNGDLHLSSACNNPKDTGFDIHKDIDRMVRYASKSNPSEQKLMMIWTKLVQPFVSIKGQLPKTDGTVAPQEACEHCGLSKTFLSGIADNVPSPLKSGGYHVNMSNKSASTHDPCHTEIEEGEFIPDAGNIQLGSMLGPGNGATNHNVSAPCGDGSSFRCPGRSICDHSNRYEARHESRESYDVETGSLAYSKITAELNDMKGGIPCCSLAMLLRLHQGLYERLLVAKKLSRKARTRGLYKGFKDELFHLLAGSTSSANFEDYCLTFLGPKSYVLFTLNDMISQIIKQLDKICPVAEEDNSISQPHERVRGPDPPKDSSRHQNTRSSPGRRSTNGSLVAQGRQEEGEKGIKHLDDNMVKPMPNHFQRRKKRKLENSTASMPRPGVDDLAPKRNS